jgi:hypothetical protein
LQSHGFAGAGGARNAAVAVDKLRQQHQFIGLILRYQERFSHCFTGVAADLGKGRYVKIMYSFQADQYFILDWTLRTKFIVE